MPCVNLPAMRVDQAAAPQGEQQAAGGHEISVEALEQRQQSCGQNDVDDPARANRLLKGDRRHELLAGQAVPRRDKPYRGHDAGIEENADENSHPDGAEESARARNRDWLLPPLCPRIQIRS